MRKSRNLPPHLTFLVSPDFGCLGVSVTKGQLISVSTLLKKQLNFSENFCPSLLKEIESKKDQKY